MTSTTEESGLESTVTPKKTHKRTNSQIQGYNHKIEQQFTIYEKSLYIKYNCMQTMFNYKLTVSTGKRINFCVFLQFSHDGVIL